MVVVYWVCMWLQMVDIRLIPKTECLKDTVARVLPYWYDVIVPEIKVEIVAHVLHCVLWLACGYWRWRADVKDMISFP